MTIEDVLTELAKCPCRGKEYKCFCCSDLETILSKDVAGIVYELRELWRERYLTHTYAIQNKDFTVRQLQDLFDERRDCNKQ